MLAFRIALRYLFTPKSHRAVNIISIISMAGVAVATMATIVVLSVFNGFTGLAESRLGRIDPELKVVPAKGKVFADADSLAAAIATLPGVSQALPVLVERGLVVAGDAQLPVRLMGADFDDDITGSFESTIIDGVYATDALVADDSIAAAQISVGVAMQTGLRPADGNIASIYVPRRKGRINTANPAAAYRRLPMAVSGVFQIDQPEYDNDYLVVPLGALRSLLEYNDAEASAINVTCAPGAGVDVVQKRIEAFVGSDFRVLPRQMQQADTFRMIAMEKWITFLMLVFILLIASFNIVSTLSLLIIEKRSNMETLRALGAPRHAVVNVFVHLGTLITSFGGVAGLVLGVVLAAAQQHFGFIKLDGDPAALSVDSYPVHLLWSDVAIVAAAVLAVGFGIGQMSRIFLRKTT